MLSRKDLEIVIQKKKLDEVFNWFCDHFITCDQVDYLARSPLAVFQGPTGCGKSTTLTWISNELGIPIKEFTETTDLTSIDYELMTRRTLDHNQSNNTPIDKRKADKFFQFVIDNIRYKSLINKQPKDASMLESKPDGVIIHIETPLSFAKNQHQTIQTLSRLIKIVKEVSRRTPRRVAIVFENIEGDNETLSISGKLKSFLGITIFKFNPIIKSNMKNLINKYISQYRIQLEDNTIEQLITDSHGDMTACVRTLQLICNSSPDQIDKALQAGKNMNTYNSSYDSGISNSTFGYNDQNVYNSIPILKKQKFSHGSSRKIKLDASLMRDTTQSSSYFHILGKIFYQKRYYPLIQDLSQEYRNYYANHNYLDRPFRLENNTETLLNMLYLQPRNLLTWLHHHYPGFCCPNNLVKADTFLENLTEVDLLSLDSSQSSQFYEFHKLIDELQAHLAIDITTYSLYHNMLTQMKNSYKKEKVNGMYRVLKPSVENKPGMDVNAAESLYSFRKPLSLDVNGLSEKYSTMIDICYDRAGSLIDKSKLIVDYLPYMKIISQNKKSRPIILSNRCFQNGIRTQSSLVEQNQLLIESFKILDDYNDLGINSSEMIEKRIENIDRLLENLELLNEPEVYD